MYPIACQCGVDAFFYWDMTYAEISTAINAFQEKRKDQLQMDSIIAYHQANQIAHLVSIALGSKQPQKEIYEAFPKIFPELEKQAEVQKIKQQNWQIMKARVEAYAANMKERRKRGEQHGNDARRTSNPNYDGNSGLKEGTE